MLIFHFFIIFILYLTKNAGLLFMIAGFKIDKAFRITQTSLFFTKQSEDLQDNGLNLIKHFELHIYSQKSQV